MIYEIKSIVKNNWDLKQKHILEMKKITISSNNKKRKTQTNVWISKNKSEKTPAI